MQVVESIADFSHIRSQLHQERARVALVPTMGALHEGHRSLLCQARKISDHVVVSIFVNPTQFGPNEDFHQYPRTLSRDVRLLEQVGTDTVFVPHIREVYPQGFKTYVIVEELSQKLCGISRPSHFRGVATIVLKLFNIVRPAFAVFGQKDAQQCVILQRMVKDLHLDVEIVVCPIVREADGLAMSSRNSYLNQSERKAATILYRCLEWAQRKVAEGGDCSAVILQGIREQIGREPLAALDYAEIVDLSNLSSLVTVERDSLLALAVFIGQTRLIDNTVLNPSANMESPFSTALATEKVP